MAPTTEREAKDVNVTLHATIPQIQSAIKFGGDGSARIQFDIPSSEIAELVKLIAYGPGKVLRLEIEEAADEKYPEPVNDAE